MNLSLKYPAFDAKVKNIKGRPYIFDALRKKWLALTPEEWVRQHLVNYLITVKKYPSSLISIEKEIKLNDLKKRFDVVVYKEKMPHILIECKAPFISLENSVAEQALRYNLVLKSDYVMITNGISDLVFDKQNQVTVLP